MQYKTMVLELLHQHSELHEQLRRQRKLLATMEQYAEDLKTSHLDWQAQLWRLKPESGPEQIASEALELALRDMENRLRSVSTTEEDESALAEAATAYRHRPTPLA